VPRYLFMIYTPTDRSESDAVGTDLSRWVAFGRLLEEAGIKVADAHLAPPETATTVRVRDGELRVTDGPFADTKEYLAGYYVLDATSGQELVDLAAEVPSIHYGSVEIRPIDPLPAEPRERT